MQINSYSKCMRRKLTSLLSVVLLFLSLQLTPANAAVSQTVFQEALSQVKVTQDEFVGNYEIFAYGSVDNWTLDEEDNYFDLSLNLTKKDKKSKWKFTMTSFYWGEDWIFHNEVNLKSSKGTLNLKTLLVSKDVDDGKVTEFGARSLTTSERLRFCKIIGGSNVTFRLRGNSGDVTGMMQDSAILNNLSLCTVYLGLLQGYKPDL
jgi:hypothetical protein